MIVEHPDLGSQRPIKSSYHSFETKQHFECIFKGILILEYVIVIEQTESSIMDIPCGGGFESRQRQETRPNEYL